jgi:hypothetical protein
VDPRFATEIGRLQLAGQLTSRQAEIAHRIGDIYWRWHRAKRLRVTPKSPQLNLADDAKVIR